VSEAPSTRRRFGPSITVQIVALLIAGVAVGQIVTLLIVMLLPPPRAPVYRMSEIAAAINGAPVRPRDGREMVRTVGEPPPIDAHAPRFAGPMRAELATLLNAPLTRVRLEVEPRRRRFDDLPFLGSRGRFQGRRRERDLEESPPSSSTAAPNEAVPPRPPLEQPPLRGGDRAGLVFGPFKAALQRPSGDWIVVQPAAEPFPSVWQSRVILWFLACLAVLGPGGYLFARRLVAPIGAFAQAADRLGRDPGAPLLQLRGPAEIGTAARAFNDMQARLKRYVEDRTSMIGAISHDLRTPLTRIRFKMEAASTELKGSVGSDLDQMEAMISAVLTFVHDAGQAKDRTILDLQSVLECVVDDAVGAGGEAELSSSGAPTVDGDALSLQRLFANLVDNAIKYGRRAHLRLYVDDAAAVTEIADEGPGLPSRELERAFEPFYRAEPSRNRQTGGIGLGLSVARSIARAHGGDVYLRSGAGGLIAVVRLPLTGAQPAEH
jgi:two-component system OmpR family sensor kinase